MNSSDPTPASEEKWTAYLDGKMSAADRAAFERGNPEAAAEKDRHDVLAKALRSRAASPVMKNADFFNESILRQIQPEPQRKPASAAPLWPLWRLATAALACLAAVAAIYVFMVKDRQGQQSRYVAQVLDVKAGDELLSATALDADGLAVVWIDGLDFLPDDYVLE